MLLLYRFSFEVEKARNCLDLNLGPNHETDDHIVPMVTNEQTPITAIGGGGGFHANLNLVVHTINGFNYLYPVFSKISNFILLLNIYYAIND